MYTIGILYITLINNNKKIQNKILLLLTIWLWLNNNNILIEIMNDKLIFNNNYKIYKWLILVILLGIISISFNKNNSDNKYIIYSLLGSILIVISNNKLILIISLEIQSFSIYIIVSNNKSLYSINYYLLGSISSVLILLGIIKPNDILLIVGILFKLSIFPISKYWVEIYNKINIYTLIHVINVPKISILLWISINIELFMNWNNWIFVSLLTITFGAIGGLYSKSLQKIISYSSINQVGIIIILILINEKIVVIYLTQYIITTIILKYCIYNDYNIENLKYKNKLYKIILVINLISLISIPFSLGFFGKIYLLEITIISNSLIIIILVLINSIITSYYYYKIINSTLIINNSQNNYNCENNVIITIISLFVIMFILDKELVIHIVTIIII